MIERFETFTALITKIARNIRKIKNEEMAEYDLRSAHISCLYYLYTSGAMTATELCERCEEDKATISRALDHLETNGYLIRRTKSVKRYKSPLSLTEKGRKAGEQITDKIYRVLDEMDEGMTEAERAEFYRCLAIISERLDAIGRRFDKT